MRNHVAFDVSFSDNWHPPLKWYLHGDDILAMVRSASAAALATGRIPAAAGDQRSPWVLDSYAAWVGAARALLDQPALGQRNIFFRSGGRAIKKAAKGPDTGDGYYVSDVALSGAPRAGRLEIWARGAGASYREFGQMFRNREGGPMAQVAWSKATAAKLRDVLTGVADYSRVTDGAVEAPLPMLACAMFLSEVARNKREFAIGLMMLDMIGESYGRSSTKRYTLDKVFSHPDRLATRNVRISKPQSAPISDRYTIDRSGRRPTRVDLPQTVQRITDPGQLFRVEGKYPASPGKSAATSDSIAVADDYIQQKEASIATRWLARRFGDWLGADQTLIRVSALRHDDVLTGYERIGPGRRVNAPRPLLGGNDADNTSRISQRFLQSAADEFVSTSRDFITARTLTFD